MLQRGIMKTTTDSIAANVVFVRIAETIDSKYQAGEIDWKKVDEIKQSLKDNRDNGMKGLFQVPVARLISGDTYELAFARHRRAAFFKLAEEDSFWNEIPLIVREMDELQLFEALAIENLQRRDINPMEKAEMYSTYMHVFGKTSQEAAQFFNTTEEDIRGSIRFSKLHPMAQEMLRDGRLNVTQGRTVLSAQKVLSSQWTEKALKDIQGNVFETPQVAIRNALMTDENVVHFGGTTSAFFEDKKKFPTKYLAPLPKKQVAEILDVQNEDKARKISMALVVERLESGMAFSDEEFPMFTPAQLEKVRILVNPPACQSCDLHVALNGSHYCGLKLCFDRKTNAWQQAEIVRHAKELKIALYVNEQTDGKALELSRYIEEDRKLFQSRHADLRLKPTTRTVWNNFEGVPNNLLVVVVGKTAEKRLKKEETAVKEQLATREQDIRVQEQREREQEAKVIKIEFLKRFHWEVVSPAFAVALDGITNLSLLHFLLDPMMNGARAAELPEGCDDEDELVEQAVTKMKKADGLWQLRRLIMHHAVYERQEVRVLDAKKPMIEFAKACQGIANEWGVKLGRTWMSEAEKYQIQLDAALKELKKEKAPA